MHEIADFLAKLEHIADLHCSCDEGSARATALVSAFSAVLYDRLGIEAARRPTRSAKAAADQTLVELRRQILAVEAHRREPLRAAFTAARHRIDMERRVLAARLVAEGASSCLSLDDVVTRRRPSAVSVVPSLDRQLLAAMRWRLADRRQIARSRAAIDDSLRLLALYEPKAESLRG